MATRPIPLVSVKQAENLRDDMTQGILQYYRDLTDEWLPTYPALRPYYYKYEYEINDQQFYNLSARAIALVSNVRETHRKFRTGARLRGLDLDSQFRQYQMLGRLYHLKAMQLLHLEERLWKEVPGLRQQKQQQQQHNQQQHQQAAPQQKQILHAVSPALPIISYLAPPGFANTSFRFDERNLEDRYRHETAYLRDELRRLKQENENLRRNLEALHLRTGMRR